VADPQGNASPESEERSILCLGPIICLTTPVPVALRLAALPMPYVLTGGCRHGADVTGISCTSLGDSVALSPEVIPPL